MLNWNLLLNWLMRVPRNIAWIWWKRNLQKLFMLLKNCFKTPRSMQQEFTRAWLARLLKLWFLLLWLWYWMLVWARKTMKKSRGFLTVLISKFCPVTLMFGLKKTSKLLSFQIEDLYRVEAQCPVHSRGIIWESRQPLKSLYWGSCWPQSEVTF